MAERAEMTGEPSGFASSVRLLRKWSARTMIVMIVCSCVAVTAILLVLIQGPGHELTLLDVCTLATAAVTLGIAAWMLLVVLPRYRRLARALVAIPASEAPDGTGA